MLGTKSSDGLPGLSAPDARGIRRLKLSGSSLELELMIHGDPNSGRRPLLILNPIELPLPPSEQFCVTMWEAGYQVYFVRRPGYGKSPSLPQTLLTKGEVKNKSGIAVEAALMKVMIEELDLQDIVLLGVGTSNSVCTRLAQLSPNVSFTAYSNPLFNPGIWDVIRPDWLRRMIRQTVMTRSGMMIAARGLKAILRRDPLWFYNQFAQKSEGDIAYVNDHPEDFLSAGHLLQGLDPNHYFYELRTALIEDTRWSLDPEAPSNAVILSGVETTENWKKTITAEAERLGLPLVWAPSGDLFVAYASPQVLLETLAKKKRRDRSLSALVIRLGTGRDKYNPDCNRDDQE